MATRYNIGMNVTHASFAGLDLLTGLGQQFRHLKGLGYIVVGPAIQAAQAIIQTIASRDDEQGNRVVLGSDAGQHLQPILSGQTEVE